MQKRKTDDEKEDKGDEDGPASEVDLEEAHQNEVSDDDPPSEPGEAVGLGADTADRPHVPFVGWRKDS